MLNAFKNIIAETPEFVHDNVDASMFAGLNRWFSFSPYNAGITRRVDRLARFVNNKKVLCTMLNCGVNKNVKFIKYHKKVEADEFLVEAIKKFYCLSQQELRFYPDLVSKADLKFVSKAQGWDKKLCEKYNVGFIEPKKEKLSRTESQKTKGLGAWL